MKHHISMKDPVHLAFSYCILQKLLHCWWWRLTDTTMTTFRLDEGPAPLPDMTEAEMLVFLAITIQMGHCIWDKLTHYWAMINLFNTSFYSNAIEGNRILTHFRTTAYGTN